MRKYLYLITEHPDPEKVGKVEARDSPRAVAEKNREVQFGRRNVETGDALEPEKVVGLGYHDFEDQQDYEQNWPTVVTEKLQDIDTQFLTKAGIDTRTLT